MNDTAIEHFFTHSLIAIECIDKNVGTAYFDFSFTADFQPGNQFNICFFFRKVENCSADRDSTPYNSTIEQYNSTIVIVCISKE